ncbi:MAG: hypothetical protein ACTSRI_01920 [Promethearchaeota archaeon]
MHFALMFNILPGGVSEPIPWSKDALQPDRSIILLDEASLSLYLWHGVKQGLVARRTALRQAQSLKGHGYTIGKSIIGRDIKFVKEIDQRKVGRDPETDELNSELQEVLNKKYKELNNLTITFDLSETKLPPIKTASIQEPKTETKPKVAPIQEPKTETKPKVAPVPTAEKISKSIKELSTATEYESTPLIKPKVKPLTVSKKLEPLKVEGTGEENLLIEAKKALLIISILEQYNDIWISKNKDGKIAIEMMDGPICQFSIQEGSKVTFSTNSFTEISGNIKETIIKKYNKFLKLL